jgi:hypothetical protein
VRVAGSSPVVRSRSPRSRDRKLSCWREMWYCVNALQGGHVLRRWLPALVLCLAAILAACGSGEPTSTPS